MADPYLVDGNYWRHEAWAVELRRAAADTLRTPVPLRDAIEQVFVQLAEPIDCTECYDIFDGAYGNDEPSLNGEKIEALLALHVDPREFMVAVRMWLSTNYPDRAARVPSDASSDREH